MFPVELDLMKPITAKRNRLLVFSTRFFAIGIGLGISLGVSIAAHAATLQVGPGKTYAKPCLAIAAAAAGDTVEIDAAGSYAGDTCAWSTDNLTVRGVGGRPKLDITGVQPAQQKGLFTISAANATIENLEFAGAAISAASGNNGAGIRHQGTNLTVRGCVFHDNQNGILGSPAAGLTGQVLIENSEFYSNGAGDGFSHNMYLGNYATFILRHSYSHRGKVGHLVKSRALVSQILYNRITDEMGGSASYEIDLPNGGTGVVLGNIIEQSATSQNPAMLAFGEESVPSGYDSHLYVVNNTFLNTKGSGTFVSDATTTPAVLTNNIFWNGGTVSNQSTALLTSNFVSAQSGDPGFVNVTGFDVHLLPSSPCIDKGTDPGSALSQSLSPVFQYVHPESQEARGTSGTAIDIGAYEYGNRVSTDVGDSSGGGTTATGCSCQIGARAKTQGSGIGNQQGVLLGILSAWILRRKRSLRTS